MMLKLLKIFIMELAFSTRGVVENCNCNAEDGKPVRSSVVGDSYIFPHHSRPTVIFIDACGYASPPFGIRV